MALHAASVTRATGVGHKVSTYAPLQVCAAMALHTTSIARAAGVRRRVSTYPPLQVCAAMALHATSIARAAGVGQRASTCAPLQIRAAMALHAAITRATGVEHSAGSTQRHSRTDGSKGREGGASGGSQECARPGFRGDGAKPLWRRTLR
eukprot:1160753-Pelagomonas_calceolata.AAC.7